MKTKILIASALSLFLSLPAAGQKTASEPAPANPATLDAGARLNPMKIAQLKWYIANSSNRFPVGNQPYGLCFDGANIWAANNADGTVSKVRASDGVLLGSFTVPGSPFGVAFDGANIWVTSSAFNNVTKLRASDAKTWALSRRGAIRFCWRSTAQTSGRPTVPTTRLRSCVPATAKIWVPSQLATLPLRWLSTARTSG